MAESLFSPAYVSVRRFGGSSIGLWQLPVLAQHSVLECPEHTYGVFHLSPVHGCDTCAVALAPLLGISSCGEGELYFSRTMCPLASRLNK